MESLNVGQMPLSDDERDTVYELERGLQDELRKAQTDKLRGGIDQATLNSVEQSAQERWRRSSARSSASSAPRSFRGG